ncbi:MULTISPECIES: NADH-quinone oxidoreductase subunit NuoN [unclassified Nocardioides]|uniref:NADH-quinone oxidoreductase subunit NuoN n=1 Tax=unclassified Nocardioides TaxID=2615069 RepID=UPI0006FE3963|nr:MULTISPECIES: NADH-quinone oxidoreductase subunit NuoN [unclassified Nocardioides]KQY57693.1 NADH:ubiquinone oxidoreductase subunit N [Nocardioides sp. Root140]KQZ67664.1 NADH:ubiquinone oxidoreductase subunit N [Nocardioides sp. Root151]KRF13229.1 NADH:ubiquinone oxidoreductase subunit N [Nocardioides sp. Soil796]
MEFSKPTLEYDLLWPLLLVFGVACAGVLVEAFLPRARRYLVQTVLALAGTAAALGGVIYVGVNLDDHGPARGEIVAMGALAVDGPTVFLWGLLLVITLAGILLFAERRLEGGVSAFAGQAAALPGTDAEREASTKGLDHTEVFPLMMFAVGGMMLFPASNDLLTLFVGLEVLSLPLYLLSGLARRRRLLSQEAALKYFLLGAFSSGFVIYGIALVYGYAGTMDFGGINEAIANSTGSRTMLLIGIGMISVGLLFKVGAVPFQSWTPDVYQGAPTQVTAFMAAATKVAAFGAMMRLFYVAFGSERWSWAPMLWVIAVLSMVVGAVLAIAQSDIKRMLAYSSITHTGFIITGLIGARSASDLAKGELSSTQAVLFYLVTYGLMTVGAFAIVTLVRDAGGEATHLSRWTGLGKQSPLVAGVFALFLLGFAGIPLTAGFVGKWAVFASAMSAGAWPVVVIAVLTSALAAFFYIRVIVLMYFYEPIGDGPAVTLPSFMTATAIGLGAVATVVLGVVPGPVLDLAAHAGEFIR